MLAKSQQMQLTVPDHLRMIDQNYSDARFIINDLLLTRKYWRKLCLQTQIYSSVIVQDWTDPVGDKV